MGCPVCYPVSARGKPPADFRRRFWVCLVLTISILLLTPLIQGALRLEVLAFPGDQYVLLALSAFVYGWGGLPFLEGAVQELRLRRPAMMTLIAVAISAAFFYGVAVVFGVRGEIFFWELATLVGIMLLGHWLEMRSVMGAGSLNEAMLTRESTPVEKREGDMVIGGSINGEGALEVDVKKTGADTYLAQVIELVRKAQASKSRSQNLADRAAFVLTLVALSVGAVTLIAWLLLGEGLEFALGAASPSW